MEHKRTPATTVVAREFDQVIMCYPDPDKVCLEGGCIYCDDSVSWWTIQAMESYARTKGVDHLKAFRYGERKYWWNLRKKLGDAGDVFRGVGEK